MEVAEDDTVVLCVVDPLTDAVEDPEDVKVDVADAEADDVAEELADALGVDDAVEVTDEVTEPLAVDVCVVDGDDIGTQST